MKRKLFRKDKIIALAVFCGIIAVLYALDAPCIVQAIIKIPCPSCGMTRACLSLLRLDIKGAFEYNPLFLTLPLILLLFWFDGKLFREKWLNYVLMLGIFGAFVVRWLLIIF